MRLENLKNEYPPTPENIRVMIEHEVKKQIQNNTTSDRNFSRISGKKAVAAALVATLAIGTTVFAGSRLYQWHTQKEGTYGLKAGVTTTADATDAAATIPDEIPELSIKAGYLPEGMVAADDGSDKYFFEATPYQGGVSLNTIVMDEELSADHLPLTDTHVTSCESLTIGGKDALLIEKAGDAYNKMYIALPEHWQIIEMFIGDDVTKEEAIKVAEGLEFEPSGTTFQLADAYTWSDCLHANESAEGGVETILTATGSDMKNTHKIGDTFMVPATATTQDAESEEIDCLQAKVTDVQISDDLSLLNEEVMDPDMETALDHSGKLQKNEISYIKTGDGINSLDEVIRTEKVGQKLVYTTVEYTNTGNTELTDVLFFGTFTGIEETENGYVFFDRAACDNDDATDTTISSSIGCLGEMDYYDIHGGERGNNYIPSIQPGETVTVHIAKIVNEDELDKMYLSLSIFAAPYEFTEESLELGYVDIRQ